MSIILSLIFTSLLSASAGTVGGAYLHEQADPPLLFIQIDWAAAADFYEFLELDEVKNKKLQRNEKSSPAILCWKKKKDEMLSKITECSFAIDTKGEIHALPFPRPEITRTFNSEGVSVVNIQESFGGLRLGQKVAEGIYEFLKKNELPIIDDQIKTEFFSCRPVRTRSGRSGIFRQKISPLLKKNRSVSCNLRFDSSGLPVSISEPQEH